VALTAEAEQRAKQAGIFFEPREIADGIAVQVWRYEPGMQAKEKTVDPLSLWLSLRKNRDDRIPSWVGEDRLIPLKAVAWMEMSDRVKQGEVIDCKKKINKHLADIVQLSALLQPGQVIELPAKLQADLQTFARAVVALNRTDQLQAMDRVAAAYAFDL
jgi:hypothetical protein